MRDYLTGRRKASFPTSELLLEKALSNIILLAGIFVFVAQRFCQGGADVLRHRRNQFETLLRGNLRTFQPRDQWLVSANSYRRGCGANQP